MSNTGNRMGPWALVGFALLMIVIALACCGNKAFTICDGKVTSLAPGQKCPEK